MGVVHCRGVFSKLNTGDIIRCPPVHCRGAVTVLFFSQYHRRPGRPPPTARDPPGCPEGEHGAPPSPERPFLGPGAASRALKARGIEFLTPSGGSKRILPSFPSLLNCYTSDTYTRQLCWLPIVRIICNQLFHSGSHSAQTVAGKQPNPIERPQPVSGRSCKCWHCH